MRLQSQRNAIRHRPKSHDFGYALRTQLVVISVALLAAVVMIAGCSSEDSQPTADLMVYVDTATDEALVHQVHSEWPVVHPHTGAPTLMPAMHCPQCQKWRALPPMDVVQRSPGARKCPVCNTELQADGPWPESTAEAN